MWEQGNNVPAIYAGFFLHVERGNEPLNIKLCTLIFQISDIWVTLTVQLHAAAQLLQLSCCVRDMLQTSRDASNLNQSLSVVNETLFPINNNF